MSVREVIRDKDRNELESHKPDHKLRRCRRQRHYTRDIEGRGNSIHKRTNIFLDLYKEQKKLFYYVLFIRFY